MAGKRKRKNESEGEKMKGSLSKVRRAEKGENSKKKNQSEKVGRSKRKNESVAGGSSGSKTKRRKMSGGGANTGSRKRIQKNFVGGGNSDPGHDEESHEALGLEGMGQSDNEVGERAIIASEIPDTGYVSEDYRDIDENEFEGANGHGGIEAENHGDLTLLFGEEAKNDDPDVDADSGDEGWDDDKIPDPLSSDEEDEAESRPAKTYREDVNPEELLGLGKTFSSAEEFKHALLRYTLKTRYNIKLYRSSALKLGAKCAAERDEPCPWSVYCSYEKRKQKLMIKGYVNNHVPTLLFQINQRRHEADRKNIRKDLAHRQRHHRTHNHNHKALRLKAHKQKARLDGNMQHANNLHKHKAGANGSDVRMLLNGLFLFSQAQLM